MSIRIVPSTHQKKPLYKDDACYGRVPVVYKKEDNTLPIRFYVGMLKNKGPISKPFVYVTENNNVIDICDHGAVKNKITIRVVPKRTNGFIRLYINYDDVLHVFNIYYTEYLIHLNELKLAELCSEKNRIQELRKRLEEDERRNFLKTQDRNIRKNYVDAKWFSSRQEYFNETV